MDALAVNSKIGFSSTVTADKVTETHTLRDLVKKFALQFSHAYDVYEERRALRQLSDEMLKDLGVSRTDINKECSRSFFDTPNNRK